MISFWLWMETGKTNLKMGLPGYHIHILHILHSLHDRSLRRQACPSLTAAQIFAVKQKSSNQDQSSIFWRFTMHLPCIYHAFFVWDSLLLLYGSTVTVPRVFVFFPLAPEGYRSRWWDWCRGLFLLMDSSETRKLVGGLEHLDYFPQ